MRVVTPFKPFKPESEPHLELGKFNWRGAIDMHRECVHRSCGVESYVLTDARSKVARPVLRYPTQQTRLMLWILEVSLAYLASDDFDQDTVFISPDVLCFADLWRWFKEGSRFDIGVIVRTGDRFTERPLLNSVQLWPVRSKEKLIAFFTEAYRIAQTLPEEEIVWGADTTPLVRLLQPVVVGSVRRGALRVRMIDGYKYLRSSGYWLRHGGKPIGILIDFKYKAKLHMRKFFKKVVG